MALTAAFVFLALSPVKRFDLFGKLEAIVYDVRLRLTAPGRGDAQVVIIDIDEASLKREGRWPWPRHRLAALVTELFERHRVRAIGFDVVFAEADASSGMAVLEALGQGELRNVPGYAAALSRLRAALDFDRQFAAAIQGRLVVLGDYFTTDALAINDPPPALFEASTLSGKDILVQPVQGYVANIPELQQAARGVGHVEPAFDADNVVRRVPLVQRYHDAFYPALSLALVQAVIEARTVTPRFGPDGVLDTLDVGGLKVPVDAGGVALVPYRGRERTFRYFSAADVLAERIAANAFAGAIALVGASAKGLRDSRASPFGPDFPGVEIHASLISGMLNQDLKSVPPNADVIEAMLLLICGIAMIFAVPHGRPLLAIVGTSIVAALAATLNIYFWRQGSVIPLASTLILVALLFAWNMLAGFFREARANRVLSNQFGEYVPPQRVAQMRKSGERFSLEGEARELTVLFCDVRDFTALSEELPPRELSALLNAYLSAMTEIIHAHRGTIDKYVGDAIVAFWGAPVANIEHARDAISAALAMQERMRELRRSFAERGWPALEIGIGLNTGTMNVGDMGSRFRKAYTVMGDAVNLGARLEGLTRIYGVPILVGEATREQAAGYAFCEIDRVRVKGRIKAETIFEPLAAFANADEVAAWTEALALYRQCAWSDAIERLTALALRCPQVRLYRVFLERCKSFLAQPPGPEWDGAFTFTGK